MAGHSSAKTFILDTNVILHDPTCIHQFQDNDIVIPLAVIEEIDRFKRGSQVINLNAREFARTLDALTGNSIFNGGVSLGPGKGVVRIVISKGLNPEIRAIFSEDSPDHRILSVAYDVHQAAGKRKGVVLVTKDVNMRMKAKALGIRAEDYTTDRIRSVDALYSGKEIIEDVEDEFVSALYQPPYESQADRIAKKHSLELIPNKYFILRNPSRSVLACFDHATGLLRKVDKTPVSGIKPRNAEQIFAVDALTRSSVPLVTLTGKAGTGKTLLALASAIAAKRDYRQIFVARPLVPLSNKDMGYLPGDIESKLAPYMQPIWDNLKIIQNQYPEEDKQYQQIDQMIRDDKLVIEPLSYIRGRSLQKIYFIVDEAQNLTPHEIKTIITRAGDAVKIVITGDIYQIDHPYLDAESNGLSYLIEHFKGQSLYSHINLEKGERSELAELASNLL
ncbi:MAG TPA: PhoH family protein [Acidobacteriota bacterium]|nr:PhoH family protein [Acidobacteriota bacterium]